MRAKAWRYAAVLGPMLLVSACLMVGCEIYREIKGDPDDMPDTTVSQVDAIHRMDELVHELLGLLPSQARSVSRDGAAGARVEDTCEIGMEKKRSGQVHVSRDYQIFGLAPERFAEYVETFVRYARSKGWMVRSEPAPVMGGWFGVDEVFSIDIRASDRGFFIGATTKCIWQRGHRPP